jgi:hypothetical protein
MVYKRHEGDVVLARFFIHGSSDKAIRFIKRRGKFYRIDDITHYRPDYKIMSTGVTHIDTMVEITPEEIIRLINAAMSATLNWTDHNEETYEIWVNHYIHSDLFGVEKHD